MKTLLVVGYSAFDVGIFDEKDVKLTVIKIAIRKNLENFISDGLEWLIFGGNLGFEYWVLQVALDMKKDGYNLQFATIFPFKTHGQNWNESNQEKLKLFKNLDFVQYAFDDYQNAKQFREYNDFLINNAEGAFVFYDEENETKLKYLIDKFKTTANFFVQFLRFDNLQEIADEMNDM
ncbi:UPF0398 protein YfdB [Lactococcus hodotermopsidis]|uniref:UPF0398 protein YfdB n=1 Tax=Pseudolactococcus hodotermopsidis TaxID=2709157 RepID=A0A6A0B9U4_9LACT|nr:SLOG family protein [Lactococcus hodotermopsidis]GFH42220.1 UPF0398 protein YfdB [Lactococcus hodotermopsidis]